MAGMGVVTVETDERGNIDLDDLREKASSHTGTLAALMITYPSTHGVFEPDVREICDHGIPVERAYPKPDGSDHRKVLNGHGSVGRGTDQCGNIADVGFEALREFIADNNLSQSGREAAAHERLFKIQMFRFF